MRISDWSSDVCSSDLFLRIPLGEGVDRLQAGLVVDAGEVEVDHDVPGILAGREEVAEAGDGAEEQRAVKLDRKSVVSGKSGSVRVDLGGRGSIKKNKSNE